MKKKGVSLNLFLRYPVFQVTFEDWMVGVKIVSSKWLVKCFKKGRQVDTRLYEIENS